MKRLLLIIVFALFQFSPNLLYAQKIFTSIRDGNIVKVEKWLMNEEKINKKYKRKNDESETELLHVIEYAAFYNQKEILNLFIKERKRFEFFEEWISDALAANIHNCDINTVKTLIDAGASVNNLCNMCRKAPPVAIALLYNCFDIYNLLLTHGASLINEGAGYDVIHHAAACDSLELLKKLVEIDKLNIECKSSYNQLEITPVFCAAEDGKLNNLSYLVEQGAKLNQFDKDGYCIIHYVSNLDVFKYLEKKIIKTNLIPYAKLNNPQPIFHSIIENGNKELFDYYIANYINDVWKRDKKNRTALFKLLYIKENKEYFFNVLTEQFRLFPTKELKKLAKKMKDEELLKLITQFEIKHPKK
jgi:ankyrin repeat protein